MKTGRVTASRVEFFTQAGKRALAEDDAVGGLIVSEFQLVNAEG